MFGNKKKIKDERSLDQKANVGIPKEQDIYTTPEDRREDPIEPFTADEALNRTIDGAEKEFNLLVNEVFIDIDKATKHGKSSIKFNTRLKDSDINAGYLRDYVDNLGYKTELIKDNSAFGEPYLYLFIGWFDSDDR